MPLSESLVRPPMVPIFLLSLVLLFASVTYSEEVYASSVFENFDTFKYEDAKYKFSFSNTFNDLLEYKDYIKSVFMETVNSIAKDSQTKPFYWNILTWVKYENQYVKKNRNVEKITRFELAGETKAVFERNEYIGAFGNSQGTCSPKVTLFDGFRKSYTLRWGMQPTWGYNNDNSAYEVTGAEFDIWSDPFNADYNNVATFSCNNIITDPSEYGFDQNYGSDFDMTMDLETFMTAVSLNLKIINSTSLESSSLRYAPDDSNSSYPSFFDPRIKGMQPLYCAYNAEAAGNHSGPGGGYNYTGGYYGGGGYGGGYSYYSGPGGGYNYTGGYYGGGGYGGGYNYYSGPGGGYNYYGSSYYSPMEKQTQSRRKSKFFAQRDKMKMKQSQFETAQYIEPQIGPMELSEWEHHQNALLDFQASKEKEYCYLKIGGRLCLPAFVPLNEQCLTCDVSNPPRECSQFNLMATCLFHDDSTKLLNLPARYDQPTLYQHIQKAALKTLEGEQAGDYSFCDNECSLYVVGVADDYDFKINDFNHQLKPTSAKDRATYAHCNDTFTTPDWERLYQPPEFLFPSYYSMSDEGDFYPQDWSRCDHVDVEQRLQYDFVSYDLASGKVFMTGLAVGYFKLVRKVVVTNIKKRVDGSEEVISKSVIRVTSGISKLPLQATPVANATAVNFVRIKMIGHRVGEGSKSTTGFRAHPIHECIQRSF